MCPLDKGVANLGLLCYPIPVFMGVIRSVVNHTFVSCDQAEKDKSIHVNMGWAARVCFIGLPFDPNWQEDWQLKMLDIPNSPFTLGFHKGCFVCIGGDLLHISIGNQRDSLFANTNIGSEESCIPWGSGSILLAVAIVILLVIGCSDKETSDSPNAISLPCVWLCVWLWYVTAHHD